MANDMNQPDPEEPGTDPTPPTADETAPTKAVNKFNDYLNDPLKGQLDQAKGAVTVGCLAYEDGKSGTNIQVCRLEDAQKVRAEYRGIQNCVSTSLAAHAAGVSTAVASHVTTATALDTQLTTSLNAIKAAKNQLVVVRGLIGKLENALKDSCNADERNAINQHLPTVDGKGGLERFNFEVGEISTTTKDLCERVDSVFDVSVKYAGVQASVNVACLTDAVAKLKTDADALVTNVADNGTQLDAKVVTHQTALDGEITSLGGALFMRQHNERHHAALVDLEATLTTIVGQDCANFDEAGGLERIEAICTETVTTFKTSSPCPEEDNGTNKFNVQDQPSC
ncbi:MAG: hypothetical protein AAFZ52_17375 [Bacteroidota bacterium]